jgi:hypothetical protein
MNINVYLHILNQIYIVFIVKSSAFLRLPSIMCHSVSTISNNKIFRTQLDNLSRLCLIFLFVQSPYDHMDTIFRDLFHMNIQIVN